MCFMASPPPSFLLSPSLPLSFLLSPSLLPLFSLPPSLLPPLPLSPPSVLPSAEMRSSWLRVLTLASSETQKKKSNSSFLLFPKPPQLALHQHQNRVLSKPEALSNGKHHQRACERRVQQLCLNSPSQVMRLMTGISPLPLPHLLL